MTIVSIAAPVLALARRLRSRFAPLPAAVEPLKVAADLCCRSRRELVVENATLRHHQLSVLRRGSGRPRLRLGDRLRLLLSASLLPAWREAIVIVQPQTIGQRIPGKQAEAVDLKKPIEAKPALGGLHHDYRRAA